MKITNKVGIVFFGSIMALMIVLPLIGDFVPTSGKTYEYSDQTLEAEKIYASIAEDLVEARETTELAKLTYESAIQTEESIQKRYAHKLWYSASSSMATPTQTTQKKLTVLLFQSRTLKLV